MCWSHSSMAALADPAGAASRRFSRSVWPKVSGKKNSTDNGGPIPRCLAPCRLRAVVFPYVRSYTGSCAKVTAEGEWDSTAVAKAMQCRPKGEYSVDIDAGLVGHWKLDGDCNDHSGTGIHGRIDGGVTYTAPLRSGGGPGAALFDGRNACVTVPHSETLALGSGDFSLAAWVNASRVTTDVPGDILSKFNGASRRGFNFGIQSAAGVSSSQSNWRNAFFGIDDGKVEPVWTNHGRPGNAVYAMALAVHNGSLYAGTYEGGAGETGHVYRFTGGTDWEDCGAPADCNAVSALAEYGGDLYAAVSCYRAQGSAQPNSPNQRPGGSVYRYAGGAEWVDCGQAWRRQRRVRPGGV